MFHALLPRFPRPWQWHFLAWVRPEPLGSTSATLMRTSLHLPPVPCRRQFRRVPRTKLTLKRKRKRQLHQPLSLSRNVSRPLLQGKYLANDE